VCVLSPGHAATVRELHGLEGKCVEIPNGVDVDAFIPGPDIAGVRRALGIAPDAIVVAYVATLDRAHYLKRPDLAVAAVAAAADPRLHLLVIGGGDGLEAVRARAADAGLGERTTFTGAAGHERLPDLLRAADVLLCPSDLESFGMVLIEAMACGLPTVSTDLPGIRAVVEPGHTGWIAGVGDVAALAGALRAAVEAGADGRAAMGEAGRARCLARYGWESVVDRVEGVYEAVSVR
jgi:glycosyltransferase involved in cell wall biosynthesis